MQQPAVGADKHAQREARLRLAEVCRAQEIVRQRLKTEVEHQFTGARAARPALEKFTHGTFAQGSWLATAAAVKRAICARLKAIMSARAMCRA